MAQAKLDISKVRELHHAGDLPAAKNGYLTLIKSNPKHVDALHGLAILYTQEDNLTDATNLLQSAIQLTPKNPVLYLHLANVLKLQGLFSQAADLLLQIIALDPNCLSAYNNLGSVYFAQGKISAAIAEYKKVIAMQPDYTDAHYNLGLALLKDNQLDAAIKTYEFLLENAPTHFPARFHLACTLMRKEQFSAAEKQFLIINETHAFHFETQTNLATCYIKLGSLKDAKIYYLNALELSPQDTQVLYNLGVIDSQLGNIDQAIQHYQRAIHVDPNYFEAHNNVGTAFIFKKHVGLALHHFTEALRLRPQNEAVRYTVDALSKNQLLLAAPPDYITTLFDAYADHYDAHLINALEYQVPAILLNALIKAAQPSPASLSILDLGCGTGLCGTPLKPYAKNLIGIDVSANMLAMAAQKNLYDELIKNDFIPYLQTQHTTFDLMVAGDVLVYIGDLDPIFMAIKTALREKGLFAFNTEISEQADFEMLQSGRFAHRKQYIDTLAQKYGFNILFYNQAMTRQQNNEPVMGHVFVLERSS